MRPTKEAQARAMVAKAGLELIPFGKAWWIKGNGVDMIVADLGLIAAKDLMPWHGANFVQI